MIKFEQKGDFSNLQRFLINITKKKHLLILEKYGREGVSALESATPIDSGITAGSWGYEIHSSGETYTIHWTNDSTNKGVNIAILIQYGHGTGTGGYVQGRDFINPALKPIFDRMADEMWKEVTQA